MNIRKKLWVYDKVTGKIFESSPQNIGGQKEFYYLDELIKDGLDPLILEKQLSDLEYEFSNITNDWFRQLQRGKELVIPEMNRELVSTFLTVQLLRTVEAREQFAQLYKEARVNTEMDSKHLQASILWDDNFIKEMSERISSCIWIFGQNKSDTPFCTSDDPVKVKTYDNKQWMLGVGGIWEKGMYIVFPLTPTLVMYCKDPTYWAGLKVIENCVSPVEFNRDMVDHENSGQIGMSYRFIYSPSSNFEFAKSFLSESPIFKNPDRKRT